MKKVFLILLAACLLCGCSSAASKGDSLASPLLPHEFDAECDSDKVVRGYSPGECGLEFSELKMLKGADAVRTGLTGADGIYLDSVFTRSEVYSASEPESCGRCESDALQVFTGRDPIFYGSLDVIEYKELQTGFNTVAPMGILQAFKKSDLSKAGARIKIGFYDSTYNTFVKGNKTGAEGPEVRVYYIDSRDAEPFIFWENGEYAVYDWLPMFLSVEFTEWVELLEPIEAMEPYPTETLVKVHSAAKAAFNADTLK